MRYAIINSNIVDNVVIWNGIDEWQPPVGSTLVELLENEWCNIGSIYREGEQPRFVEAGE